MRLRSRVAALLSLCSAISGAAAQEHAHPNAPAAEQLGAVHFPTSCAPGVALAFDRAVALLHSFEFGAAIRAFSQVAAADSSCAMAHWGVAMSRWSNPLAPGVRAPAQLEPGLAAARAAARPGGRATPRERAYIGAIGKLYDAYERVDQATRVAAYERAMDDVARAYPSDTEAKIFHAVALVASASPTDKTYARQLQAAEVLEALWKSQPNHPGLAHYIIHAYDYPPLAARARMAAQRYAQIAPSAAHALHMPSHTFTRVGLWEESIATNRKSYEVALREGSIAEALHALDYATYAYLQLRRDSAARAVVDGLPALAARFDVRAVTGAAPGSAGVFALAAIPARYALERREWEEAARLEPVRSDFPWTEAMVYFARALGGAHSGALDLARAATDSLAEIHRRLSAAGEGYWAEQVAIEHLGAQAWLAHAERRDSAALHLMREGAQREGATEKSAVTPGPLVPARELLGDLLLALGRPREALAEYQAALASEPNRYLTLDGARRAAGAAGDRALEEGYAARLRALTGR